MTVGELIAKLEAEFPSHWRVEATKAGGSLLVSDPNGPDYAFVFTYAHETRRLTRRPPGGEEPDAP